MATSRKRVVVRLWYIVMSDCSSLLQAPRRLEWQTLFLLFICHMSTFAVAVTSYTSSAYPVTSFHPAMRKTVGFQHSLGMRGVMGPGRPLALVGLQMLT